MIIEYQGKKYKFIKQRGGKLLGEGGFGCVVTPPLRCRNPLFKTPYSIDDRYVSKIIEYDEDKDDANDILNELKFGRKLSKVDPRQRYFSPIINGCLLEEQKHPDVYYSRVKTFKFSRYSSNSSEKTNDNKCQINSNDEYLNLILKNAGIDFKSALTNKNREYFNYFRYNYKAVMHHFCDALMILHRMDILHRDLKPWNIMINLKPERNKATLNVIDFGLSEELKKKQTILDMIDLTGAGSEKYIPMEVIMLRIMLKIIYKNKNIIPKNFKSEVLSKAKTKYKSSRTYYLSRFYFGQDGFIYEGSHLNKTIDEKHKPRYGNKKDRYKVFYHLLKDITNKTMIQNFTGHLGHIYKWDVFALGIIFAEIIVKCDIQDELAFDLVNKMVNYYYWERYDIKECLNHPFFKSKTKSSPRTRKRVASTPRPKKKLTSIRREIKEAIKPVTKKSTNQSSKKSSKKSSIQITKVGK